MASSNNVKNFTLILYMIGSDSRQMVSRLETKSIRRFRTRLKLLTNPISSYLRVSYLGGGHNDGYYSSAPELLFAFEAFVES